MARLQATYRARVLASKYITLRERMKVFQAFCRGFLARQEYKNRLRSIIKIQSGIRVVLAKRRTQELRVEVRLMALSNTLYGRSIQLQSETSLVGTLYNADISVSVALPSPSQCCFLLFCYQILQTNIERGRGEHNCRKVSKLTCLLLYLKEFLVCAPLAGKF